MSGNLYAIELMSSGRDADEEFEEIQDFINKGYEITIVNDYEEVGAELIIRGYL